MSPAVRQALFAGAFATLCVLAVTFAVSAAGRPAASGYLPASTTINGAPTFNPGILTSGDGTVTTRPDMAVISVGVDAQAATATAAQKDLAGQAARLISRVKSLGVADRDIDTSGYWIGPSYTPDGRIDGYQASEQLVVKWHNVDTTGSALDALVQQGGAKRISVSFGLADPKAAKAAARALAIGDARSRATAMAQAAGVQLGQVLRISDLSVSDNSPNMSFAPSASAVPTQVPVGQLDVTVTVEMDFAIV